MRSLAGTLQPKPVGGSPSATADAERGANPARQSNKIHIGTGGRVDPAHDYRHG